MRTVTVAATQMHCTWDLSRNMATAEQLIRQAAAQGAQIILIQELFCTPYFCIEQLSKHFNLATPLADNPQLQRFQALARELQVVLPFSWFEKAGNAFFNTVAMVDADGSVLGTYRKAHIPNAVLYQEKYYFSPGDTGLKVWKTRYANIGLGICWDQWFPEAARCMTLLGADLLLYPTAIGNDITGIDCSSTWQRVMQGHAAANVIPIVASNRVGMEKATQSADELHFFGHSFIADETGELVQHANTTDEGILVHTFNLDSIQHTRNAWSMFRDRRPDLYGAINSLDGQTP